MDEATQRELEQVRPPSYARPLALAFLRAPSCALNKDACARAAGSTSPRAVHRDGAAEGEVPGGGAQLHRQLLDQVHQYAGRSHEGTETGG